MSVVALESHHVDAAAALVRERLAAARRRVPLLPGTLGEGDRLEVMLARMVEANTALATIEGPSLVGFLGWMPLRLWGSDGIYVPEWGCAVAEPGRVAALHAVAAARWAADGRLVHAVTLFTGDAAAEAEWHHAGFGRVLADSIRSTEAGLRRLPTSVTIRRARVDDAEEVSRLEQGLHDHLAAPPVFRVHAPPDGVEVMARRLTDPQRPVWVVGDGPTLGGYISCDPFAYAPAAVHDDGVARCDGMYVEPGMRRRGVARALVAVALEWAAGEEYSTMSLDYETANVEASRFWPAVGWTPVLVSVARRVVEP